MASKKTKGPFYYVKKIDGVVVDAKIGRPDRAGVYKKKDYLPSKNGEAEKFLDLTAAQRDKLFIKRAEAEPADEVEEEVTEPTTAPDPDGDEEVTE